MQWVRNADGWTSNGFVIRPIAPSRWALSERPRAMAGAVRVVPEPLRVEATLSGAKREAELLAAAERRGAQRRRLSMVAVVAIVCMPLAGTVTEPWNAFTVFGLAYIALRALATMALSWLERYAGSPDDFYYA